MNIKPIKRPFSHILLAGALALTATACEQAASTETTDVRLAYEEEPNLVDTIQLKRTVFQRELVSNGKLRAINKSDLKFKVSGQLEKLPVKNGDVVSAGQTLAMLVQVDARQALAQAELNMKNAKVNFDDLLIRYGGGRANSVSPESVIYKNASLSSGYAAALQAYEVANYELKSTVLKAPFRGKVANLTSRVHEQVGTANVFCTVIDDSQFDVEFYLIESEIAQVSLRDEIRVIPFSRDKEYIGYVSEINPVVNDQGMVLVKGTLRNEGSLWEGMNAKVVIGKDVAGQLVVPKTAVVLRQDQEVLFTYENGKALWTYINILSENSSSYAVEANPEKDVTLEAGAYIITSGNLNLAHESDVEIRR